MNDFLEHVIHNHLKTELISFHSVSGGCINNAYQLKTEKGSFFLKWNKAELAGMFESEASGLQMLNEHSPIHTPKFISTDIYNDRSFLLTEWIERGTPDPQFWESFGTKLANQHKVSQGVFGLDYDNFIGSLPQSNSPHANWVSFFTEERLIPQLKLAAGKNLIDVTIQSQFNTLFNRLEELVPSERPALLHGDLWSGNFMINSSGQASIFDPAVHYGHRETELAFTKLFGGFSPDFYQCYHEEYPLEPGFEDRVDIHNLYPLLVHVNLFGSSYLSGIVQTLRRFT